MIILLMCENIILMKILMCVCNENINIIINDNNDIM